MDESDDELKRHHHRVVLSLLALGVPPDRVEEIAQAAWERIWTKHRAGELPSMQLPGLAIAQARFLAFDHFRRSGASGRDNMLQETEFCDPLSGPEAIAIARDELERVGEVLARCRPRDRDVFRLFYIEGARSATEVAERLGITAQRVRQILCEVRKTLRETMRRDR